MVWIWSKTKLAAFIKKVTLIELRKYFKHIQKKILEQVKEMVADECRLQMNARMEAAIAAALNDRYEALNKELFPIFTELLARIKGLEEVDATVIETADEMAKRIESIENFLAPTNTEPVPGSVLHNLATMGDILAMTPEQRADIKARLEEIQTMREVAREPFPPMPNGTDASDSALVRRIARRALGLEG